MEVEKLERLEREVEMREAAKETAKQEAKQLMENLAIIPEQAVDVDAENDKDIAENNNDRDDEDDKDDEDQPQDKTDAIAQKMLQLKMEEDAEILGDI
mmetsp:Transcript_22641/g.27716  ORF Transcript_22641/g.27716 Transcript_22641/m.27716 type:complete len:98 (+) Transcript_22641:237-530(+)